MKTLVRAMRRDFKDARLPVVIVQIGRFSNGDADQEAWSAIREQQRLLPEAIERLLTVPSIDLSLDDPIHISGCGQHQIGKRAAEAMDVLCRGRKGGPPPPALAKITLTQNRANGTMDAIVTFKNVAGELTAAGRPWGFTITDGAKVRDCIYDVELKGARAVVKTGLTPPLNQSNIFLSYGYGTNPYCNITDSHGRALPAFGPLPLGAWEAVTPFATRVKVSKLRPWPGRVDAAQYPVAADRVVYTPATFQQFYCQAHERIAESASQDKLIFFRARYTCAEDMRVKLLFGYDGPVCVFSDTMQVYCDPSGTNPITIDEAESPVLTWKKGLHEVVFALGTNGGRAWGICLRLRRMDAGRKPQPETTAMPEEVD
jgi:sialate O-acetylesterase